jgi:mannan endo-1,4-beta-mannosidase
MILLSVPSMPGYDMRRLSLAASLLLCVVSTAFSQFQNFITARGDKLMDGDRELRFISVNIPNLHYNEDFLPFSTSNPWRLPDEFEIRDAMTTVKQMNGKVARMYTLSVRREDDTPGIIRHVEAPGIFNEEAFKTLDRVLQIANETGIRLIIPFVDNWRWWGGRGEYAAFRGKSKDDFWTDRQLIEDFKKTIAFVLNRTNTCTGVPYREDRAILAWETGNELESPFSWTKEIAAYVKSLDRNHLLVEGTNTRELSREALEDPNLDILSTHHYGNPSASLEYIVRNREFTKTRKPYIIGEYGIVPTEDIRILTDTIINQGLSGGMIWSLRTRAREGGFYCHYEYNKIGAYRWPGFPNGSYYDESLVLSILYEKAWQIEGASAPRLPIPGPPQLLDIKSVGEISWKGSVGATSYVVERRKDREDSWTVLADAVDESRFQYHPLFNDETAEIGGSYFYRVRAKNDGGVSDYSNVVGPIAVTLKKSVDEMEDFSRVFQKDGSLQLFTYQYIRRAKEDRSRLAGAEGSYIVYRVPSTTVEFIVEALAPQANPGLQLLTSTDGQTYSQTPFRIEVFSFGSNDYRFFHAIRYRLSSFPAGTDYVKIVLDGESQIGRVEYSYR